jgi:hypothetical protein
VIGTLTFLGLLGASGPARWDEQSICLTSCFTVPVVLGIVGLWLLRVRFLWHYREYVKRRRWPAPRRRVRWFIAPVCALLISSTFLYPWPLAIRFNLSRSAFETALKDFNAGKKVSGQWIGLYHVKQVLQSDPIGRPEAVAFETGSSFIDPVGFEFDPHPNHPTSSIDFRIAPMWYTYEH